MEDTYDLLRRAIIQILGPRPSAERRRQIATDLRALADQQERMAARESGGPNMPLNRPATANTPAEARQHEVERTPGMYVRISFEPDPQTGNKRVRLSLAKQIWYDLGSPERIDVQQAGGEIWIVPATGKAGYKLAGGMSTQSCVVGGTNPVTQLEPGRYAASIRAGAIIVGARVA